MSDYVVRGYSLGDDDIAVIKEQAVAMGSSSDSAALRFIVRDWAARVFSDRGQDLQERTPAGGVMPAGALDGRGE